MREGIIVLAHGSQGPRAVETLRETASQVRSSLGGAWVILAFLQFNHPSLAEAIAAAAGEGLDQVIVVPFFLAPGVHVEQDIPRELEEARGRHPGMRILYARALGADPRIAEILLDRVAEARRGQGT